MFTLASAAAALLRHHVRFDGEVSPILVQLHHLQRLVGHGHAAGGPLRHIATLDVGVEEDGVVVGSHQGEDTGAVAVVDGGGVGTHEVPLQGHGEAPQPTDVTPRRAVGAGSGGPLSSHHLVGSGHRLQGLEQEERTVLTPSCCGVYEERYAAISVTHSAETGCDITSTGGEQLNACT